MPALPTPNPGQDFLAFGGALDVRVQVDTGVDPSTGGLWGEATWGESVWGSEEPSWHDITEFVQDITTEAGAERWGERFDIGTATILLDNTRGIFTPDTTGENPFHQPWRPGRRLRIVVFHGNEGASMNHLFYGFISSSNDTYDDAGFNVNTTVHCLDFMGLFGRHNPLMLGTPTGIQSTSDRVEAALDRMDWDVGARDIQTGEHTMQSSFLAQSTLEECQKAADAEGGSFFTTPEGIATFKARDWLLLDDRSVNIQRYLGGNAPDDEFATPFIDVQVSWEDGRIYNQVAYARAGSTMQEVEDETSQSQYGIFSYSRTDYQNAADDEVLELAQRYLAAYKDNKMRVNAVTISMSADDPEIVYNSILWDTQFGDRWYILVQPPHDWSYDREVHVYGIAHHITPETWEATYRLDDVTAAGVVDRTVLVDTFNPLAWWRFNEVGGTSTNDSALNHDLTWNNTPVLTGTGGPNGTGLVTLDGVNEYATVANETDLELFADTSIEMWVRPHAASTEDCIISCRASSDPIYDIFYDANNQGFKFSPTGSALSTAYIGGLGNGPNEWYHLVVTIDWDGSNRIIAGYLNGDLRFGPTTYAYQPSAATRAVHVGRLTTTNYFDGDLGELVIYDRVLTAQEVLSLYNTSY